MAASMTFANSDNTTPIKVGSTEYQAPTELLMSCVTIASLIEDMGLVPGQVIPIPTQQNQEYSIEELDQFFKLFDFSQRVEFDRNDFYKYAKLFNLTQHQANKFLLLINFLDNSQFQCALCSFYAYMIYNGDFRTP